MGSAMISKIADNIISPLGFTTEENFEKVLSGNSDLCLRENAFGLPEPFCGSLLNRDLVSERFDAECGNGCQYSFFEKLCILSAKYAIDKAHLKPSEYNVIFVISTTKGNVDILEKDCQDSSAYIGVSAKKISNYFGNPNTPIVASNACISGVCAQIEAVRALLSNKFRYAVVIGCDVLSKFIVSGFQSFKALSQDQCKPYDKSRCGLNLGEAAGTIILKSGRKSSSYVWHYVGSSIHNDANHISGPSRTGEGSFRVLVDILASVNKDEIAFINAHGTATPYNDEMESIAIHRASLDDVPVNGLKGYYGHTLGAAGVIETILSMKAVENGVILATKGFEEIGTSYNTNISNEVRQTDKKMFIKILSGFGGSNAGIAYEKGGDA